MRRLIRSRLIWIYTIWKCVSEFTWCPNLPDFTLDDKEVKVIGGHNHKILHAEH